MSVSNVAVPQDSLLISFATIQLADVKPGDTKENLLLELIVCAFFFGASKQLDKQSGISEQQSRLGLGQLIMHTCDIPESSAISVLASMEEMARQHGVIDNTVQQGIDAAELWLTCETSGDGLLQSLVAQYHGHALYEYGIGMVSCKYEAQTKLMFLSVDESLTRVHRRSKKLVCVSCVFIILGLIGAYLHFSA